MLVFLSLAAVGLFFLLISAFVGDHIEAHPEVEVGGIGFLSVRAVAVFLTAFGTVGAIANWYGKSTLACSLWGVLSGVLLSVVYIGIMGLVKSQESSSLIDEDDLIGCTGRLTVGVAPGALGEVSCTMKSMTVRRTVRAADGGAIAEGALVRIKELHGDVLVVEELHAGS